MLAAFLVFVLAAPVVEEVVFRGILYRGLAQWRPRVALVVSAALFSIAHLRPSEFWYYFLAGVVLARMYRRFGLVGSVATHALFNGALVVATLIATTGTPNTVQIGAATIQTPAVWHQVSPPVDALAATALTGPGGSALLAQSHPIPPGQTWSAALAAHQVRPGAPFVFPGTSVTGAQLDTVPAGTGVMIDFTGTPSGGEAFEVAGNGLLWVFMLLNEGSTRATNDFTGMLNSLALTPSGH